PPHRHLHSFPTRRSSDLPAQSSKLIDDARGGAFNAVFVNAGGLRWFAQVVPDREFGPSTPKPQHDPLPTSAISEHDALIVERARDRKSTRLHSSHVAISY